MLVRTVYTENQPSRVQVVTYRLADGVLKRQESNATRDLTVLDAMWQAALEGTDTAQPVVLQAGVNAMAVQQCRRNQRPGLASGQPNGAAPGQPSAAREGPPPIPTGLQVTLLIGGQERGMVKVFLLGAV